MRWWIILGEQGRQAGRILGADQAVPGVERVGFHVAFLSEGSGGCTVRNGRGSCQARGPTVVTISRGAGPRGALRTSGCR